MRRETTNCPPPPPLERAPVSRRRQVIDPAGCYLTGVSLTQSPHRALFIFTSRASVTRPRQSLSRSLSLSLSLSVSLCSHEEDQTHNFIALMFRWTLTEIAISSRMNTMNCKTCYICRDTVTGAKLRRDFIGRRPANNKRCRIPQHTSTLSSMARNLYHPLRFDNENRIQSKKGTFLCQCSQSGTCAAYGSYLQPVLYTAATNLCVTQGNFTVEPLQLAAWGRTAFPNITRSSISTLLLPQKERERERIIRRILPVGGRKTPPYLCPRHLIQLRDPDTRLSRAGELAWQSVHYKIEVTYLCDLPLHQYKQRLSLYLHLPSYWLHRTLQRLLLAGRRPMKSRVDCVPTVHLIEWWFLTCNRHPLSDWLREALGKDLSSDWLLRADVVDELHHVGVVVSGSPECCDSSFQNAVKVSKPDELQSMSRQPGQEQTTTHDMAQCKGEGKREIPEKTHRPAGIVRRDPTRDKPGVTSPGIEPDAFVKQEGNSIWPLVRVCLADAEEYSVSRTRAPTSWQVGMEDHCSPHLPVAFSDIYRLLERISRLETRQFRGFVSRQVTIIIDRRLVSVIMTSEWCSSRVLQGGLLQPPLLFISGGRGGIAVRLLPLRRTWFDSRRGRPPPPQIFACGNRVGLCQRSAGFLEYILFPSSFHSGAAPYSPLFTLIGSEHLAVKEQPKYLHTHLHCSSLSSVKCHDYTPVIPETQQGWQRLLRATAQINKHAYSPQTLTPSVFPIFSRIRDSKSDKMLSMEPRVSLLVAVIKRGLCTGLLNTHSRYCLLLTGSRLNKACLNNCPPITTVGENNKCFGVQRACLCDVTERRCLLFMNGEKCSRETTLKRYEGALLAFRERSRGMHTVAMISCYNDLAGEIYCATLHVSVHFRSTVPHCMYPCTSGMHTVALISCYNDLAGEIYCATLHVSMHFRYAYCRSDQLLQCSRGRDLLCHTACIHALQRSTVPHCMYPCTSGMHTVALISCYNDLAGEIYCATLHVSMHFRSTVPHCMYPCTSGMHTVALISCYNVLAGEIYRATLHVSMHFRSPIGWSAVWRGYPELIGERRCDLLVACAAGYSVRSRHESVRVECAGHPGVLAPWMRENSTVGGSPRRLGAMDEGELDVKYSVLSRHESVRVDFAGHPGVLAPWMRENSTVRGSLRRLGAMDEGELDVKYSVLSRHESVRVDFAGHPGVLAPWMRENSTVRGSLRRLGAMDEGELDVKYSVLSRHESVRVDFAGHPGVLAPWMRENSTVRGSPRRLGAMDEGELDVKYSVLSRHESVRVECAGHSGVLGPWMRENSTVRGSLRRLGAMDEGELDVKYSVRSRHESVRVDFAGHPGVLAPWMRENSTLRGSPRRLGAMDEGELDVKYSVLSRHESVRVDFAGHPGVLAPWMRENSTVRGSPRRLGAMDEGELDVKYSVLSRHESVRVECSGHPGVLAPWMRENSPVRGSPRRLGAMDEGELDVKYSVLSRHESVRVECAGHPCAGHPGVLAPWMRENSTLRGSPRRLGAMDEGELDVNLSARWQPSTGDGLVHLPPPPPQVISRDDLLRPVPSPRLQHSASLQKTHLYRGATGRLCQCNGRILPPGSLMRECFAVTTYKTQPACLESLFWELTHLLALRTQSRCVIFGYAWTVILFARGLHLFLISLFHLGAMSGEKVTRAMLSGISVNLIGPLSCLETCLHSGIQDVVIVWVEFACYTGDYATDMPGLLLSLNATRPNTRSSCRQRRPRDGDINTQTLSIPAVMFTWEQKNLTNNTYTNNTTLTPKQHEHEHRTHDGHLTKRRLLSAPLSPERMAGVTEVSMEQRRNEGGGGTGDPKKTRRPEAPSGMIPTCENPAVNPVRIGGRRRFALVLECFFVLTPLLECFFVLAPVLTPVLECFFVLIPVLTPVLEWHGKGKNVLATGIDWEEQKMRDVPEKYWFSSSLALYQKTHLCSLGISRSLLLGRSALLFVNKHNSSTRCPGASAHADLPKSRVSSLNVSSRQRLRIHPLPPSINPLRRVCDNKFRSHPRRVNSQTREGGKPTGNSLLSLGFAFNKRATRANRGGGGGGGGVLHPQHCDTSFASPLTPDNNSNSKETLSCRRDTLRELVPEGSLAIKQLTCAGKYISERNTVEYRGETAPSAANTCSIRNTFSPAARPIGDISQRAVAIHRMCTAPSKGPQLSCCHKITSTLHVSIHLSFSDWLCEALGNGPCVWLATAFMERFPIGWEDDGSRYNGLFHICIPTCSVAGASAHLSAATSANGERLSIRTRYRPMCGIDPLACCSVPTTRCNYFLGKCPPVCFTRAAMHGSLPSMYVLHYTLLHYEVMHAEFGSTKMAAREKRERHHIWPRPDTVNLTRITSDERFPASLACKNPNVRKTNRRVELLRGNARPRATRITAAHWSCVTHTSYILDLAPSDLHVFDNATFYRQGMENLISH
ncbi:hypothetical protein PR048_020674 [Dryococelus australis]|uniref:Uncharacterized protein n=1 Tax=Dryococelus australis TaxID=614101 RepID=A0ABQ9H6X8_9NEOP|nr:hypothetical protein PR048_020674 [Dryococelus australis]